MKPKLSIVIPAYNEAQRLSKTLPQIIKFFQSQKYPKEIIIVDDGSTDNTQQVVRKIAKNSRLIRLVVHSTNQGKGAGVRTGVLASKGEYVLFMDADLSTPLTEITRFWPYTKQFPVIIGSRKTKGAKVTRHQDPIRENLGKIFTWLTNNLATHNITDVTCGFKLFKGSVARKLFKLSQLDDWSFDAEILFLAQKKAYQIKEIPVTWQNDPRTKVNILHDGINALLGLAKIRINSFSGFYD